MPFLLFVVVASGLGIAIVVLRHRRPTSMEHSIAEFERGLQALAPGTVEAQRDGDDTVEVAEETGDSEEEEPRPA